MKKIIVSILLFFFVFELLLRLSGIFKSTNEVQSGKYYSQYRQFWPSWFHTWTPGVTIKHSEVEFEYLNTYNDLGHRELDFSAFLKDTLTDKIVCIGDSFTEGDGAPADSTWVKRVEVLLNQTKNKKPYRLYNAGACGSDVYFNNKILVEKLVALKPKMVIECVNSSDIYDIIHRGGKERFNEDGTTSGKVGPGWEPIYKYSHIFRTIVRTLGGYDSNLIKVKERERLESEALNLIKEQITETANFCKSNGIEYVLLIHPTYYEIYCKDINNKINATLKNEPHIINLFPPMTIFYVKNNISDFSWKINGHFNSKGYFIMGDMVFEKLTENSKFH